MNDTIDLLHRHRSGRRFTDDLVPDEHIRAAVEAGQSASTSSAVQSYGLIHVTDDENRRRLADLTGPQPKVAECGAFFVVCGDTRRHRLAAERHGRAYDTRLEAFLLATVDATLFAQNLVVAFESLGYGICYIGGLRNRLPEVDRLLALPEGVYPLYGLCVGVPDETPSPRPRLPVDAVLFSDTYPDDESMNRLVGEYDTRYTQYLRDRGARDPERTWSKLMADKFAEPHRTDLGGYYAGKGADLS
jgi:FMN reductase (NADPH)